MKRLFVNSVFGSTASIRRQILSTTIIGIILLSLFGSLLTAWVTNYKVKQIITTDAVEELQALSELAALALSTRNHQDAKNVIQQLIGNGSIIGGAIINGDGQTLANQNIESNFIFQHVLDEPSIHKVQMLETPNHFLYWQAVNQFDQQIELDNTARSEKIVGRVVLKISKQSLIDTRIDIFLATFSIGSITSIFLIGLINITVNRLIKPIDRLSDLMVESKQTGMHLLSTEEGPLEIRKMAKAYNAMITAQDLQEETLRTYSEQLEQEVVSRTQALERARDAALTASRHKSTFLANVTHELRTPMQSIIGYIDLVKEELELDGENDYLVDLNKAQQSSERLLLLINDILDISKVEAGRMDINLGVVEVKPIIQSAIDAIAPLTGKHQNLLVGPQNQTELFIETDQNMLVQIVINLLSNACKFTKQGTISIDYYCDQTNFYLEVIDTGCGINKTKLNDIFDEFRQVTRSKIHDDKDKTKDGTGLGLAISQKFALLLGGEITVVSELGEGSEFKLRLPL